jgi:hypothetical protein
MQAEQVSLQVLPEAIQFIETHRSVFMGKPCAIFTVCMTLAMKGGEKYPHLATG